ncbi:acetolactate synthase [Kaustia mangrovi]|uniref:Acetolactate synthase n=1 Tax=Kaustia mangrovi TaxID=2593653 RepID=A0A7S8C6L5_9HYPH|nr:thiamine pyrophosphate-dependent enzyme [Kaustia mangrovi]QPC44360.1 acetolactate synthase [Kaustia mangrovi]
MSDVESVATSVSGSESTAGREIVACLKAHDLDRVFCVPGESFLGVIDALRDDPSISLVTCRHEGGAGFMALADARLMRRPGVVMVSRGPGASNATIAIQTAQEDGVPLVVLVGQVERGHRGRRAFQEVDYAKTYSDLAKWCVEITDPARAGELMAQAIAVSRRGIPGPVVVVTPEDMLEAPCPRAEPVCLGVGLPGVDEIDVAQTAERLAGAKRPLVIAGQAVNHDFGRRALRNFADVWGVAVAASSRQADVLENTHGSYVAHLGYAADRTLVDRLREADLVLAIGTRLGDVTSQGYTFPTAPMPEQALIHVHEDASAIGGVRHVTLGAVADCALFLDRLSERRPAGRPWEPWVAQAHAAYLDWSRWQPVEADDGVVFGAVVDAFSRHLPDDAIVTADAGNFGGWLNRYFRFRGDQILLGPLSGAMGYGVPAAAAAAMRRRKRKAVCFVGDGGFMMTGNELATAIAHDASPVVVIADNGSYGTIRLHQEKRFPGRAYGTALANPDFTRLGEAFGAKTVRVEHADEVEEAVRVAVEASEPVVLHVKTSLEHISATARLSALKT